MSDENDRIEVRTPIHMPINPTLPFAGDIRGMGWDRVGVDQAKTPSGLVAGEGEQGVRTEWDAGNLDSAITWLESHAEYLHRLSYDMIEIKDKLGGDQAVAGESPLGGFQYATQLAQRHAELYTGTETGLRNLSETLYNAADALREVKRKYEDAEGANAMTAQQMQEAFAKAASGDH
ncbi:hypothetical protein ACFOOK_23875 [Micromonospora krabiensis]|uniref:Uncharacterized protein n=1 Tax=Micromonospora krabiensis TaxID=307121 RepID=A0A1C3N733_9ACTN|nr:hypothetical protein [Micromonospora krabiensis]SBV28394.1 hypothetical protein GA0070620_3937 [Micromonospora krabiensis]